MDEPIDVATFIGVAVGLLLVALLAWLLRRGIVRTQALPRVLGLGTVIYSLSASLLVGLLVLPRSYFTRWMIMSVIGSLAMAAIMYYGGHKIIQRSKKRD